MAQRGNKLALQFLISQTNSYCDVSSRHHPLLHWDKFAEKYFRVIFDLDAATEETNGWGLSEHTTLKTLLDAWVDTPMNVIDADKTFSGKSFRKLTERELNAYKNITVFQPYFRYSEWLKDYWRKKVGSESL